MIQPPRGFGENPVAIYHDPDLPPSHHYLAAYRWLDHEFGADAVVHLGKHGTLEWLPGKGLGLSAGCAPDAVLGELPLVYPFIVNDPGEGTQAKRRGHAVVVDHLVPPMARADTYGEMAKLEQLLDEYATVQAMDPAKLPALRARIWEVVTAAQLHHDLHVDAAPGEDDFDDFVLHIDGYLCEVKDVQIRDGLHILGARAAGRGAGQPGAGDPAGDAGLGREAARCPGLRSAPGRVGRAWTSRSCSANPGAPRSGTPVPEPRPTWLLALAPGPAVTGADLVDVLEGAARGARRRGAGPRLGRRRVMCRRRGSGGGGPRRRRGAGVRLPRRSCRGWRAPPTRSRDVLHALDGGYVPAGPSGSPTRGLVNVLPTGRNFYSVDPKAIPSRSAWEVGSALADSLVARHLADTGDVPEVGRA